MLNTTICHEDDSLRSYVAKFIEQYFKRNHIQYKISCCPSLHNLTTRFHPIDLLFTDIIFSDKTEMSTLLKIRKQHPSMMMVILTNNNEYTIASNGGCYGMEPLFTDTNAITVHKTPQRLL